MLREGFALPLAYSSQLSGSNCSTHIAHFWCFNMVFAGEGEAWLLCFLEMQLQTPAMP